MLPHLSVIAFLLLTLGHSTFAQVPFPRHCPEVKVMDTFDLDAYMGIWYEYSKYPFIFEIGKKCMYARYENIDNNTVSVINAAINRWTGTKSSVKGIAKVLGPAQLAVQFSSRQNIDKPNYLVLGTDYKNYAVVYSCTNVTTFAHTKIVWILTRAREPTTAALNDAKKIMDDNNLTQSYLIDTTQKDCPDPASDDNITDKPEVEAEAGTIPIIATANDNSNAIDKA